MIHDAALNRIARKLRNGDAPPPVAERGEVAELLAKVKAELAARGR